jgi:hypothetical protein
VTPPFVFHRKLWCPFFPAYPTLVPLNMMYVANLYKVFWDTVHPFPTLNQPIPASDGTVTLSWNNPENLDQDRSVRTSSYRIYYGTNPNKLRKLTNPEIITETSHTISILDGNNTTYYFAVTAVGTDNQESNKSNIVPAAINDSSAPNSISNFYASSGNYSATLTWRNPSNPDFEKVLIIRSTSPISWSPPEKEVYYGEVASGVYVIYDFYQTSCTDSNLSPGTTYYYKAFSYDECFNYSAGVSISTTTTNLNLPTATEPGSFQGTTSPTSTFLTWQHTIDADYRHYILVCSYFTPLNNVSYNVGENGIVYKGDDTSYNDGGLGMGTDFHYVIYGYYQYQVWDEVSQKWITIIKYGNGVSLDVRTKLGGTLYSNMTLTKDRNQHVDGRRRG